MCHPRSVAGVEQEVRRGGALLIALALLALGAALLVGSSASGRNAARAELSHEAMLLAEGESRVVIAEFMLAWNSGDDALPVGGSLYSTVGPRLRGANGALVQTGVRLARLGPLRYVLAVDCEVGPAGAVLARRRLQLLLERPAPTNGTAPFPSPTPIGNWSLSDIY